MRHGHALKTLCRVLNVSGSTYRRHFKQGTPDREAENRGIRRAILEIYGKEKQRPGAGKIQKRLEVEYGIKISLGRVSRLIRHGFAEDVCRQVSGMDTCYINRCHVSIIFQRNCPKNHGCCKDLESVSIFVKEQPNDKSRTFLDIIPALSYNYWRCGVIYLDELMERVRFGELFDAYSSILTEKQREVCDMLLSGDLTIAELGKELGVSRQGAYYLVKRSQERLNEIERALGLLELRKNYESLAGIILEESLSLPAGFMERISKYAGRGRGLNV